MSARHRHVKKKLRELEEERRHKTELLLAFKQVQREIERREFRPDLVVDSITTCALPDELEALDDEIAAIRAQIAAMPKVLPVVTPNE